MVRSGVFLGLAGFVVTAFGAETGKGTVPQSQQRIPLIVSTGVPLRVYLTRRLTKRMDEPVQARTVEPVFAFDREVIPAGTEVMGKVSRLDRMSKMTRFTAILGGDFTPLHQAQVEFTTLVFPDGRQIALKTLETPGLDIVYQPPKKTKPKKNGSTNGGVLGTGKQEVQKRINAGISGRSNGIAGVLKGPDRKERLETLLAMKLPYHPQWVAKGTRFDAVLGEPVTFGTAVVETNTLELLGTQTPLDSAVHARLTTPLSSETAKKGQNVEAILAQPVFSTDHRLILPEGTRLSGAVTFARRARWFHRGGQLRFNFRKTELPPGIARPVLQPQPTATKTLATLDSAEPGGRSAIKVDDEGGVKATEPKTRFLSPVVAALIASRAADDDAERHHGTGAGTGNANVGGRTLGGISGFGLAGAAAAQASRAVGSALGFYGMGWSVYRAVIARGGEVEFKKNADMDIRFGSRPAAAASKFRAGAPGAAGVGGL
jgi:hypothetical protein